MMLKLYVGAVAALAAAVAGIAAVTDRHAHTPQLGIVLLLGLLLWLTEFLQVRQFHYRGHGASHNLIEGILAVLLYACSGLEAMVLTFIAIATAEAMRKAGTIKLVFNVAQWTLAAGVGALVLHAVAEQNDSSRTILAVALTVVAISAVNHVAVVLVLLLAVRAANERQSRRDALSGVMSRLISNGAALVTGVTLVGAYRWSPYLIVLGVVVVIALDAAGRAHATVRADSQRLEGLQRATHALATSIDLDEAVPSFLAEGLLGFEVREIHLVLFSDSRCITHRCVEPESGGYSADCGPHPLAQRLRELVIEPTHFGLDHGDTALREGLAALDRSRALAVPLRTSDRTIGMLILYDRLGVEGFEDGERRVAAALGRELVGFLERVDLMREIDEERRKLTDIVESTSDGILTIDEKGLVTSWNRGFATMTGYSADEMIGTRHIGLLRARDTSGRDVILERWFEANDPVFDLPAELQVVAAGGTAVWLSCAYSRIPAGEGHSDALVVVARNVTQARELEKLKDDFVAVVSHELRTPLVPIKGWAQTLLNRGDRLSDDQRRTAVQSILSQAQKLESLVLNILEASRVESGRSDGDGVADVAAIAMRVVEETLSARPDRVLRIEPPTVPCNVRGSVVWVERAIANLVANAVKYSPDDQPVDVTVSAAGDDVVVAVTDRGPGIASDAHERIFERFERLEETMKQTGTGLGLYITRRLARAMGGDVTVSSMPGAGSTFLLRLPAAPVTRIPEQRVVDTVRDANVVNLR